MSAHPLRRRSRCAPSISSRPIRAVAVAVGPGPRRAVASTSSAGTVLAPARSQRRRQVDHRQDPDHARPARFGRGDRRRHRRAARSERRAPGDRAGVAEVVQRSDGDRPGEPRARRPASRACPRAAARARAGELLTAFDLAAAADRLAKTYSGGMARKLDVAIGLVHRPKVLFLDEPTTGLDPEARAQMWAEIGRLAGRGRHHGAAHHPLPRRGRPARRPRGDRRCRPGRRRGHARGAEERVARRHRARRAR